jgi:ubiquitin carboxyl-terminal hydrolase 14
LLNYEKDETDLKTLNVKSGHTFMLMGTPAAEVPKEPVEKPQFVEDMTEAQVNSAVIYDIHNFFS